MKRQRGPRYWLVPVARPGNGRRTFDVHLDIIEAPTRHAAHLIAKQVRPDFTPGNHGYLDGPETHPSCLLDDNSLFKQVAHITAASGARDPYVRSPSKF